MTNRFLILSQNPDLTTKIEQLIKKKRENYRHLTTPTSLVVALNDENYSGIFWDITKSNLDTTLATLLLIRNQVAGPIIIFTNSHSDRTLDKLYKAKVDFVAGLEINEKLLLRIFEQRLWSYSYKIHTQEKKLTNRADEEIIETGSIKINIGKYSVFKDNEPVVLTPKEFQLLAYLAQNKGNVISREQLLQKIWGYDLLGSSRIVDIHISHLRDKLENDSTHPEHILTKRGFGYCFI
ncbi:response regulator transcription factor [Lactobacillus jensenii]|jgi:response regulator|uniref:Response regulator n=3 Tax=Lactobacillus TaxID=1578 RepID=A0A0R1SCM9_9LACO|nr:MULTISPECIES: response regulator transcription factor [Lactobacillus]EEQ68888.1 transcriptional regulatory protein, C-terminal domain protein [Lactobacillus jensenii 1153]APT14373.1 transcriptional regulator [Lactobacillus jensenii]EEQ25080.1 transcriptional regulatory protein, C-terminal domain protein [Lactobacillus jensenii 269-3]EEX28121.1 transcriptional regulatory protein WalR family protein [Lactobacillus jensenii SJ-7A-US]KAA9236765.1 response regulator transcription factor [Lactoba